jgi:hypothetical protein
MLGKHNNASERKSIISTLVETRSSFSRDHMRKTLIYLPCFQTSVASLLLTSAIGVKYPILAGLMGVSGSVSYSYER